jgi:hypothetical protein
MAMLVPGVPTMTWFAAVVDALATISRAILKEAAIQIIVEAHAREQTIESSAGKVVPLNGSRALPRLERRSPADIDETAS